MPPPCPPACTLAAAAAAAEASAASWAAIMETTPRSDLLSEPVLLPPVRPAAEWAAAAVSVTLPRRHEGGALTCGADDVAHSDRLGWPHPLVASLKRSPAWQAARTTSLPSSQTQNSLQGGLASRIGNDPTFLPSQHPCEPCRRSRSVFPPDVEDTPPLPRTCATLEQIRQNSKAGTTVE